MRVQHKIRGIFEDRKRPGRWGISYCDADGKRHREMVGPKSAAIAAYQMRKTEIRLGKFFPPQREARLRFGELVELAFADKRTRLAPRTLSADKVRIELLLKSWREMACGAILPREIEDKLRALRADGLSGSTVNRYRSLLSSIFSFAMRTGRMSANPVRQVPRYKESDHRIRFLSADEEIALRKVIGEKCPERTAELDLALNTGMRRGEQFSLRWENVDLDRGLLTVRGKTGRRFIEMNSVARSAIRELHARATGSSYVAPEAREDTQRDWRRWFEDCIVEAKIDNFRWHDLRHTFASRLVMAGVDIRTVQELLGHTSILMTMRYAHLAPSHRQAAVEKLVGATVAEGSGTKTGSGGLGPVAVKAKSA